MHFDVVLHDDCGFEDLKLKTRSIHEAMTWTQVLIYLSSGLVRKTFHQNSVSDYSFLTDHGIWWIESLIGFFKWTQLSLCVSNPVFDCRWLTRVTFKCPCVNKPTKCECVVYPFFYDYVLSNKTLPYLPYLDFFFSAFTARHQLKSDCKITRGDWRNKEKISHLSSPNNPWQHRNNKFGQQKCIPHARFGFANHLSWHSSSLAHLAFMLFPFFLCLSFFLSNVQLELTSDC